MNERIKYVEQDENMLHAYRMHEMAVYDFNTSVHVAKREGIKIFLASQNNILPLKWRCSLNVNRIVD